MVAVMSVTTYEFASKTEQTWGIQFILGEGTCDWLYRNRHHKISWMDFVIPTWQSGGWDRTDCFGFLKSTRGFGHQRGGLEEVERCGFQYFAIRRLRHAQGLRETMEGFRKYLVVYKTSDLHRLARFAEFSCLCHLTCGWGLLALVADETWSRDFEDLLSIKGLSDQKVGAFPWTCHYLGQSDIVSCTATLLLRRQESRTFPKDNWTTLQDAGSKNMWCYFCCLSGLDIWNSCGHGVFRWIRSLKRRVSPATWVLWPVPPGVGKFAKFGANGSWLDLKSWNKIWLQCK